MINSSIRQSANPVIIANNISKLYNISPIKSIWSKLPFIGDKYAPKEHMLWALKDISFEVKKGETLGIIGPNGAGKSTLLKILCGVTQPTSGIFTTKGRVAPLIEVGAGLHPEMTGRENIYLNGSIMGMTTREIQKKFDRIVDFSGLEEFIDTPVKKYSSGMKVRLGFSVAVHVEPDVLLIDEVLAVGDAGFQTKCFNKIGEVKNAGTTTILVSHNMHTVSTFTEKLIVINKGKAKYFNDVAEGINEYTDLFINKEDLGIEKHCSGNGKINFYNVEINKNVFHPGENFTLCAKYESSVDYDDVEVDVGILSSNETGFYFQATNKAYSKRIDLQKGNHQLKIDIEDLRISNATVKIAAAVWSKNRHELLFWWRFPLEFEGVKNSTGKTFLQMSYEVK